MWAIRLGVECGPWQVEGSAGTPHPFCLCGPDPPHPRLHESALLCMSFFQHLLHLLDLPHVQAACTGKGRGRLGSPKGRGGRSGLEEGRVATIRQDGAGVKYLDMLSGEQAELPPVEMLVSMLSELSRLSVS